MQMTRFTDLGLRTLMLLASAESTGRRVTTRTIAVGANASEHHVAKAVSRLAELGMVMADTLIELERELYAGAEVEPGDVFRRLRVISRVDDPSGAVLVTVRSTEPVNFLPGQYVSVGVTLPDGARQLRQYSLVNAAGTTA